MPTQTNNSQTKKQNTSSKAKAKAASAPKQGGNIAQDIQRLAVPFGILLAKKGLDMAVEKNKKTAAGGKKEAAAAKPAPKSGGSRKKSLRNEMDELSNEIEQYLNKY